MGVAPSYYKLVDIEISPFIAWVKLAQVVVAEL